MSSSTDNLNLLEPDPAENWSIQNHFNANMNKIDAFAGLFMIDFGSKSVSAFHDALSSTMSGVANGQSVSFTVNFTDSISPMSSGAHTGIATRSSSTRVNIILQRSGSATNENYVGSLTSNGWSWDKVATKSQIDAINSQITIQGVSQVDFNTLTGDTTQVKWYSGTTFVGCSNAPSACSGQAWPFVLEVIKMGSYAKQILHCFAVLSQAPTSPTYVRQQTYNSGSVVWGDWSVK